MISDEIVDEAYYKINADDVSSSLMTSSMINQIITCYSHMD
jgi:hypothetical protein